MLAQRASLQLRDDTRAHHLAIAGRQRCLPRLIGPDRARALPNKYCCCRADDDGGLAQLMLTKTFKGDATKENTVFGGTYRVTKPSKDDEIKLRNFLADRFFRAQDGECRRLIMGSEFDSMSATRRLRGAFDPGATGNSEVTVTTCASACLPRWICACVCA